LPAYQKARSALSPDSFVTIYCNPHAWPDASVFGGLGVAVKKMLRPFGDQVESAALGLRIEAGPVAEAVVQLKGEEIPPRFARLVPSTDGTPEFLEKVPRRAVAFIAGRSRPDWIVELLVKRFFADDRERWDNIRQSGRGLLLGLDPLDDVLPALGENWGAYVAPAKRPEKGLLPVDGLVALELPEEPAGEKSSTREAIENAANTYMSLLAVMTNDSGPAKPAVVRTEASDGHALKWIENYGSFELSAGFTETHFILATSPDLIREYHSSSNEERLISAPEFENLRTRYFPDHNQVLFVNVAGVRRLISEHGEKFVEHGVRTQRVPADKARQQLDSFERVLQLFDTAFLAARVENGRVRITGGGTATAESATASAP
jgi:hypothetical protein